MLADTLKASRRTLARIEAGKHRWLATTLLDIEPRLRKVCGYQHLPRLRAALEAHAKGTLDPASGEGVDRLRSLRRFVGEGMMVEQVYLGVSLLRQKQGHVRRIDKSILQLFRDLIPLNGVRSIRTFVSQFRGVDRGDVRHLCAPVLGKHAALGRHVILPLRYPPAEGGMILVE